MASASVGEMDSLNILRASLLAMAACVGPRRSRSVLALVMAATRPLRAVRRKDRHPGRCPGAGDLLAASILAKTARDADLVRSLHGAVDPNYGVDQRLRATAPAMHLKRLRERRLCPEHRRSFSPVRIC